MLRPYITAWIPPFPFLPLMVSSMWKQATCPTTALQISSCTKASGIGQKQRLMQVGRRETHLDSRVRPQKDGWLVKRIDVTDQHGTREKKKSRN